MVDSEDNLNVYQYSYLLWGESIQYTMLMEECAELIQAISKHLRSPSDISKSHLAGEIVDVRMMMEQIIWQLDLSSLVDEQSEIKANRLRQRIEDKREEKRQAALKFLEDNKYPAPGDAFWDMVEDT